MAKSELTRLETSGVLRKIKTFSVLDVYLGLIENNIKKMTKVARLGLDSYSNGAYNDEYGLEIMNKVISGNGVKAVSVTRDIPSHTATYTISISSVFDDRVVTIQYPHREYS
jgi:hypothetical protein